MAPAARSPTLVGRGPQLSAARRLVAAAQRGTGAALLVTGEAGIGKSRLLAEVAAGAARSGATVLTGRAVPGGGTLRAVGEALARPMRDRALVESERMRPFRAALRGLVPAWAGTDASSGPPDGAPVDPAVVLGEGVLRLLGEIDAGSGCVLVLEDLHWADPDTVGLVSYLADAIAEAPLLLLLSARDDVTTPGLAGLAAQPSVTVLPLPRLDPGDVAALAAACRGGTPVGGSELSALVARSEGVPFLVEELLDQTGSTDGVPPTLAGLVASRVAALPAAAGAVVTVASVVGTSPDWELLSAVTGQPAATVLEALRRAVDGGLLVVDGGRLQWRHALTRDAVQATLLPPERAASAARAADVLVRRDQPGDRAAAAELLVTAGAAARAVEILVGLARGDAARGALLTADQLLARAAGTGRLPGLVAIERIQVLTLLGRAADAIEVGAAALDAGTVAGDEHAELCLGLARAAVSGGRWTDAEGYVARAGRPADPRALVLAADAAFGGGDVARADALARAAVDAPAAAGSPPTRCEALMVVARCAMGDDLAGSAEAYGRAAQEAAERGLTPWRVQALFGLGSVQLTAGNTDAPALTESRTLAVQAGMIAQAVQADLLRSDAVLQVEGARAALPLAQQAAEQAGRLRHTSLQAMAELTAAADAALAGELATMKALLGAAVTRAHRPAEVATLAPVVHALPHLIGHDLARAAALFDQGIPALLPHGSAAPTSYFGLWALVRTAVADRDDEARRTLGRHHTVCAVTNRAALAYAEAIALGRSGRAERAAERFAAADALVAGQPWWRRLLRLLALEAAVRDGWGDPVPTLRADLAAHEQAGEPDLARTCRVLLAAAGAPTRRGRGLSAVPPALRSSGITSREMDVLVLVAEGLSNAQVADRLVLSPRTVESHVASLLAKTGTADRAALRAWAAARGVPR